MVEGDRFFFLITQRIYCHFSGRATVTGRNTLLLASRFGKPDILYITSDVQYVIFDYKKAGLSLGRGNGRLWRAEVSLGSQGSRGCKAGLLPQACVSLIRVLPGSLPWAGHATYRS